MYTSSSSLSVVCRTYLSVALFEICHIQWNLKVLTVHKFCVNVSFSFSIGGIEISGFSLFYQSSAKPHALQIEAFWQILNLNNLIMSQNISLGIDWNDFNKCWNDFHKKGIQLQLYNSDKTFLQPIVFLETAKTHNAAKMIWAGKNALFCLKTFPHFFKRYPTNLIIVLHFECNMLWWTRDIRGAVIVWLAVIGHRNSSLDWATTPS